MADNSEKKETCGGCKNSAKVAAYHPYQVRQCCLDCVEKHIGAAWVLLRELQEGYVHHRLLFIGHLHEAENESVAWPKLSLSLRAYRKQFQATGAFPNFYIISKLLQECRSQSGENPPAEEQPGEESTGGDNPAIPDT